MIVRAICFNIVRDVVAGTIFCVSFSMLKVYFVRQYIMVLLDNVAFVIQVHKELQDTMAQLEAIRHEIRSISVLNPGPMTRRLVDNLDQTPASNGTASSYSFNSEAYFLV